MTQYQQMFGVIASSVVIWSLFFTLNSVLIENPFFKIGNFLFVPYIETIVFLRIQKLSNPTEK
jgi:hypothetical protein